MDPLADDDNLRNYDKLVTAIEASNDRLNLLIAVCDRLDIRDQIIDRYESEVRSMLRPFRIQLDVQEPSLRRAIDRVVRSDPFFQAKNAAVLTVIGTEVLLSLSEGSERSEQDKFLGYLQWTREGLRQFPYPIVLWVSEALVTKMAKDAPDFWSWRGGVFWFKPTTDFKAPGDLDLQFSSFDPEGSSVLSVEQLIPLIDKIRTQKGDKDPLLASLYQSLGQAYAASYQYGKEKLELAIQAFRQAINLQMDLGAKSDLVDSLLGLGRLQLRARRSLHDIQTAEKCLTKALELARELEDRQGEASSLVNLGNVYGSLGQYRQAIEYYQRSLAIQQQVGDRHGEARSLHNLATAYRNLDRDQEASALAQQADQIMRDLGLLVET